MKRVGLKITLLIGLLFVGQMAGAELPRVGSLVPAVSVQRGGEIMLGKEGDTRQPWQAAWPQSRPQLIIHVAGRLAAKQQLDPVVTRLARTPWVNQRVGLTTIVNTDDSIWGSQPFVEHSILKSKKHAPSSHFVLDSSGVVAHQWHLQPESAAVIATTAQGQIIFFQQAPFSAANIDQLLDRLQLAVKSDLNSSFH
ncbi:YtfJ family protein [Rosenbergiella epipactidis]|uniref:YtfJ family protein n=1 Tax=Rosenbergiella epipactidis TaxID=1544694 RepID=UPI001F4E97B0|nr:YtfJ family protein [Rosenbergiella epipactidis]